MPILVMMLMRIKCHLHFAFAVDILVHNAFDTALALVLVGMLFVDYLCACWLHFLVVSS